LAALILAAGGSVFAQDEDFRLSAPVPAPLRFIATEQRAQLNSIADPKQHAQLSLQLAEARLTQAESLTTQQDFIAAAIELGNYQGLIHESIILLQAIPAKGNKARDLFKRLEIVLRTHCPRLETIRRSTPMTYAANIKDVIHFAEDARDTSLNCFFGETVLREKERPAAGSAATKPNEGQTKQSP
jgi:hypothetical protein